MKKLNRKYEISSYPGQGTNFPTKECGADERNRINFQDYDHVIDESRGVYGYRSAAGEWIERPLRGSGLGPVGLDIIEALQCNPGEKLFGKVTAELIVNPKIIVIITGEIGLLSKPSRSLPIKSPNQILSQLKTITARSPGRSPGVSLYETPNKLFSQGAILWFVALAVMLFNFLFSLFIYS